MKYRIRTLNQLGMALEAIRRDKKLTQSSVAEEAGMLQKTVSLMETGSPGSTLSSLYKLISSLGYDIDWYPEMTEPM